MNRSRFARDIRDFGEIGESYNPREIGKASLNDDFYSFDFV